MDETLSQIVVHHWKALLELFAGYYIIASAVAAMPTPKNGSSQLYTFVFRFLHILSGNMARVVAVWGKGTPPASENGK